MNLCSCRPRRTGKPSARIHSTSVLGFQSLPAPCRVREYRREQDLVYPLRERMTQREIARKIIIAACWRLQT